MSDEALSSTDADHTALPGTWDFPDTAILSDNQAPSFPVFPPGLGFDGGLDTGHPHGEGDAALLRRRGNSSGGNAKEEEVQGQSSGHQFGGLQGKSRLLDDSTPPLSSLKEEDEEEVRVEPEEEAKLPEGINEDPTPPAPEPKTCRICLAGVEEETELGRLIRPCLCKGSVRYVHVECLNQWRRVSQSSSAFWSCPQCGYKYAIARTGVLGLAASPIALGCATLTLFTLFVFISSFFVTFFFPSIDTRASSLENTFLESSLLASTGDVIRLAVSTFSDHDINPWADPYQVNEQPDRLFFDNFDTTTNSGGGFKSTVRKRTKRKRTRRDSATGTPVKRGFFEWLAYRFFLGISVVGILSFVNLMMSMAFFAPIQIGGWLRRRRRDGDVSTATIVVVFFVFIGIVRALYKAYGITKRLAKHLLVRAEEMILEVGDGDEDPTRPRLSRMEQLWQLSTNWIPLWVWRLGNRG